MEDLVSFCITTKNEEAYIESCLSSVVNQSYENIEIILVDSNSEDGTVKIAKKYADKIIVKDCTIAQGRNLAASHANGKILCFLDADVILFKNWLSTLLPHLRSSENVAAYGDLYPVERNFKSLLTYRLGDISNFVLQKIGRACYAKLGTAVLIKRNFFEKVGGFDNNMNMGEDWDISLKLTKYGKLKYEKNAKAWGSMRRMERSGYLRILSIWIINSIPIILRVGSLPQKIYTREFP